MRRADRQIKKNSDIELIISRCDVCRIAFADKNTPYIVTLNFGYRPGNNACLYFHCAPEGRKIELIARNNYVCFEMDTDHSLYSGKKGCDWGMKYSSILGYGRISIISDKTEKNMGLDFIMAHYSAKNDFSYDEKIMDATTVLRLDIEEITGKQK
ncbi:MAG TPA: pyridoxamine 5'-phosphate oxidase family protein [Bacteroidales bacterium]|nr:pyridoxamine 5'-phosphate oxidase family protein [Bacteroidales bacterium]